jgi:hypothetical protein
LDDHEFRAFREYIAQLRLFQGGRSTDRQYRNLDELDDARKVLGAAGIKAADIRHRGDGQDPPDMDASPSVSEGLD